MTATGDFIETLTRLKSGDLGLLRTHAGMQLDESLAGFDLFAGLWWPLRQKNERAPRREVAWLIAKLYASCPIPQSSGDTLPRQLSRCRPKERERFRERFDRMLILPLNSIEPPLQWALKWIASHSESQRLDWVSLTDDLSVWERESTRLKWAKQYLEIEERSEKC